MVETALTALAGGYLRHRRYFPIAILTTWETVRSSLAAMAWRRAYSSGARRTRTETDSSSVNLDVLQIVVHEYLSVLLALAKTL